jgi:glycosyltransferase involved in cell wall biosynthesis
MTSESGLLNTPQALPPLAAPRPRKLVVLTEIIAPYRIPVFNALAAMDQIELYVIFLAENDPTQREWLVYKQEIQFCYETLPSWRRRVGGYHVLLNRGLSAALRRTDPDVLICGGYNYLASWQALWWAHRRRVPFLAWVESTAADQRNERRLIEFLKSQFMKNCQGFVVAGRSSAEYVKKFNPIEESIFLAPDAVDTGFFAQRASLVRKEKEVWRKSLGLPQRFFLFVGRLIKEKGVFDLIQAYGQLPGDLRREIGLVIAGEGRARDELERLAAVISPGFVKFSGFLQREELAACYALAEVFVFPTHSDPWGLVVNEAMACGLPIVCSSAAGCAADLVEDGWNGRLVPPKEGGALESAMRELTQDEKLRLTMGKNSWERIQLNSPAACAAGIAAAAVSKGQTYA